MEVKGIDIILKRIVDGIFNEEIKKSIADKISAEQKVAEAASVATVKINLFAESLKDIDASLSKAESDLQATIRQGEINAGTKMGSPGINRQDENILSNTRSYSLATIQNQIGKIGNNFGFNPEVIKQAQTSAQNQKILSEELPKILNNIAAKETVGLNDEGETTKVVGDKLRELFKNLGVDTSSGIVEKLTTKLGEMLRSRQNTSVAELLKDNNSINEIIGAGIDTETLKIFGDLIKKNNDVLQMAIDNAHKFADALSEVTDMRTSAQNIGIEADNQLNQALGRNIGLGDMNASFENTIQRLSSRVGANGLPIAGTGTLDPKEISKRLGEANARRANIIKEMDTTKPAVGSEKFNALNSALAKTVTESNNLQKAFDKLGGDSSRAANALTKINEITQQRENRQSGFMDFLKNINNPEWLSDFTTSVSSLARVNQGVASSAEIPSAIEALERRMSMARNPQEAAQMREEFIRNVSAILKRENPQSAKTIDEIISTIGADGTLSPELKGLVDEFYKYTDVQKNAIIEASKILVQAGTTVSESITKGGKEFRATVGAGGQNNPVQVLPAQKRANGGVIYASRGTMVDFKPRGTDTVPAMLSPGEFVVNARAAQKNMGLLEAINSGNTTASGYSKGGVVYLAEGGSVQEKLQSAREELIKLNEKYKDIKTAEYIKEKNRLETLIYDLENSQQPQQQAPQSPQAQQKEASSVDTSSYSQAKNNRKQQFLADKEAKKQAFLASNPARAEKELEKKKQQQEEQNAALVARYGSLDNAEKEFKGDGRSRSQFAKDAITEYRRKKIEKRAGMMKRAATVSPNSPGTSSTEAYDLSAKTMTLLKKIGAYDEFMKEGTINEWPDAYFNLSREDQDILSRGISSGSSLADEIRRKNNESGMAAINNQNASEKSAMQARVEASQARLDQSTAEHEKTSKELKDIRSRNAAEQARQEAQKNFNNSAEGKIQAAEKENQRKDAQTEAYYSGEARKNNKPYYAYDLSSGPKWIFPDSWNDQQKSTFNEQQKQAKIKSQERQQELASKGQKNSERKRKISEFVNSAFPEMSSELIRESEAEWNKDKSAEEIIAGFQARQQRQQAYAEKKKKGEEFVASAQKMLGIDPEKVKNYEGFWGGLAYVGDNTVSTLVDNLPSSHNQHRRGLSQHGTYDRMDNYKKKQMEAGNTDFSWENHTNSYVSGLGSLARLGSETLRGTAGSALNMIGGSVAGVVSGSAKLLGNKELEESMSKKADEAFSAAGSDFVRAGTQIKRALTKQKLLQGKTEGEKLDERNIAEAGDLGFVVRGANIARDMASESLVPLPTPRGFGSLARRVDRADDAIFGGKKVLSKRPATPSLPKPQPNPKPQSNFMNPRDTGIDLDDLVKGSEDFLRSDSYYRHLTSQGIDPKNAAKVVAISRRRGMLPRTIEEIQSSLDRGASLGPSNFDINASASINSTVKDITKNQAVASKNGGKTTTTLKDAIDEASGAFDAKQSSRLGLSPENITNGRIDITKGNGPITAADRQEAINAVKNAQQKAEAKKVLEQSSSVSPENIKTSVKDAILEIETSKKASRKKKIMRIGGTSVAGTAVGTAAGIGATDYFGVPDFVYDNPSGNFWDPERKKLTRKQFGGMIYASKGQLIPYIPKGTDTVPAMLTPGEFVVNRVATQKHLPLLQSINNNSVPGYSKGGPVQYFDRGSNGPIPAMSNSSGGVSSISLDTSGLTTAFDQFSKHVQTLDGVLKSFGEKIAEASGRTENSGSSQRAQTGGIDTTSRDMQVAAASISSASSTFSSIVSTFNTSISSLEKVVSSIPSSIDFRVSGGIPVNITIETNSGSQDMSYLNPFKEELYTKIENGIRSAMPGVNIDIQRT